MFEEDLFFLDLANQRVYSRSLEFLPDKKEMFNYFKNTNKRSPIPFVPFDGWSKIEDNAAAAKKPTE